MQFELLPVEDGDEDIYDMFTITSPMRWTPRKYKDKSFDGYFYDPTDATEEPQGYPALVNHLSQEIEPSDIEQQTVDNVVAELASAPLVDTQVLAAASWHRAIHEASDRKHLSAYFAHRPVAVIRGTLSETTRVAKLISKAPLG